MVMESLAMMDSNPAFILSGTAWVFSTWTRFFWMSSGFGCWDCWEGDWAPAPKTRQKTIRIVRDDFFINGVSSQYNSPTWGKRKRKAHYNNFDEPATSLLP